MAINDNESVQLPGATIGYNFAGAPTDPETARAILVAIVESSDDAIISKDLNGTITSWNRGAERIFGYTADEVIGKPVSILIPEERHDEEPNILSRLRKGEKINHYETIRRRKDGQMINVSLTVSPVRNSLGQVIGASKNARDVTEQLQLRTQSERQARELAAIVESSDDAIISKDLNGIVKSWNRGAERIFGYTADEMIGQPIIKLIPDYRAIEEPTILDRLRRGEKIDHYETIRQRKDGRLINVSLTVSPIRDCSGQIVGASKIARDISEQLRLQAETERQSRELADLGKRKDEFLAMLSHELRNPLAAITNAVHLLGHLGHVEATRKDAVAILERQTTHLGHLVNDLLEVSRLISGKIRLHLEHVDLCTIVENAVAAVRHLAVQKGMHLQATVCAEPVWVKGDAVRLDQVLNNLLTNAIKYTDEGGAIIVTLQQEGGEGAIRVRDNGTGIPEDLLPRVFELFSQAECTLDRSQGGLGIGLHLVQRLVQSHGGSVSVKSGGQMQGAEFLVRLPATTAPEQTATTLTDNLKKRTATQVSQPRRILLIEDTEDLAHGFAVLLRMQGHEVAVSINGAEGLQTAVEWMPDVILLDIGLPDMDGFEVARRLRANPATNDAWLIAVTGYGQEGDRERTAEAGFDEHIVKPVSPAKVEQLLATLPTQRRKNTEQIAKS